MASDRTYLLVDGNNVIHAWPELKELHRSGIGLAHERLKLLLGRYQDVSGVRVVLVFDGRGERMESPQHRAEHEVQVFYSDSSHTADDIIERLSAKYAQRHRITVATDDLAEQNMVYALGAEVIFTDGLCDLLESSQSVMDDSLKRYRRKVR
ncbi:MAG: NYN domain-containing protein [Verrucomicrobiota bacterium]